MAVTKAAARADLSVAMRGRVVDLFRRMCRSAEKVTLLYDLTLTPSEVRHLVNLQFAKHAHVRDPRVIDMLIVKGEMELEETLKQWKQRPHVLSALAVGEGIQAEDAATGDITGPQAEVVSLLRAVEAAAGVPHDAERAARLAQEARRRQWASADDYGAPRADQTMPLALPGAKDLLEEQSRTRDPWATAQRQLIGVKGGQDTLPVYVPGPVDSSELPSWTKEVGEDAESLHFRDPNVAAAVARVVTTTKMLDDVARAIEGDLSETLSDIPIPETRAKLPSWVASKVGLRHEAAFSETEGLFHDDDKAAVDKAAAARSLAAAEDMDTYEDVVARTRAYDGFFAARKRALGFADERA